jgi:hypothetical protein
MATSNMIPLGVVQEIFQSPGSRQNELWNELDSARRRLRWA